MSRPPDPNLERKVLDAAQKLWKKGGEDALTMRAVAKAARTNTPAVYRRFRDRDDILRALLQRVRLEIAQQLEAASSPQEGCERYLDYALRHPHEYELFYRYNYQLCYSPQSRSAGFEPAGQPSREVMRQKLQQKLGGSPESHEELLVGLWMLVHGAAMLLIAKSILPDEATAARRAFRASIAALLRGQGSFSKTNASGRR